MSVGFVFPLCTSCSQLFTKSVLPRDMCLTGSKPQKSYMFPSLAIIFCFMLMMQPHLFVLQGRIQRSFQTFSNLVPHQTVLLHWPCVFCVLLLPEMGSVVWKLLTFFKNCFGTGASGRVCFHFVTAVRVRTASSMCMKKSVFFELNLSSYCRWVKNINCT